MIYFFLIYVLKNVFKFLNFNNVLKFFNFNNVLKLFFRLVKKTFYILPKLLQSDVKEDLVVENVSKDQWSRQHRYIVLHLKMQQLYVSFFVYLSINGSIKNPFVLCETR